MGSSELNLQTEHGHIGMPSNVCCVVVEYCPGGALKSYLIKNRRRKLAFKVVVQITLDLARGLSYLHSKKIHRDVKTENMLLDKSRTVKIADFGSLTAIPTIESAMCIVLVMFVEIYCCDMPYPDLSFSEVTSLLFARDTSLLSKLACKCNEEMLGCKPRQTTRDGRGGVDVREYRHIQGRRDDPT
ncbi:peptidyl-prolyl cis-trans isomerase [Hibiscus syriacus]|uniref:Peptidyl-prolyl cis-trans isomerase n=1 Tax=Hibiscus syriacus TaxID=106335 RepID=A0A6A3D3U6_HIBSY|nr:peptidyl-prolyl cis-trans isomerase [Hibiscus syriacus]